MPLFSLRSARVICLFVLVSAALLQAHAQVRGPRGWNLPLSVEVHIIQATADGTAQAYADTLSAAQFQPVAHWFRTQAQRYDVRAPEPIEIKIGATIKTPPPAPPLTRSPWAAALWSLRMRLWSFYQLPEMLWHWQTVHLFYIIHDAKALQPLHSVGLSRGLLGIIQARGDKRWHQRNLVVLAHELLHTVGATDKYDAWGRPRFPDGYARPLQTPLHPQPAAEITAARVALGPQRAQIAKSLAFALVGPETAREIGWK